MNLSAVDLNLLLVLHAVLEERSVAKAARRLNVTSPAVSNSLARLRSALGDPLLVRDGRGLAPTRRALELEPILASAFSALETSLRGSFDPKSHDQVFTLALSDADQIASLSRIAKAFARKLPAARLRIVSVDTLVSSGGLAGQEVDAAIGPPLEGHGLHSTPLYEEQGVLVARVGHPRVLGRASAEQFNSERHVDIHLSLGKGGVGNKLVSAAIAKRGLVRDVAVTVPSFVAAASIVAQTDLLTGMPLRVVKALARSFPLQILDGPGLPIPFRILLHWHERTAHDAAAQYFRGAILEAFPGAGPGRSHRAGAARA